MVTDGRQDSYLGKQRQLHWANSVIVLPQGNEWSNLHVHEDKCRFK